MADKAKVVIFGSTGFIGRSLIEIFKDWEIVTVDRNPKATEKVRALPWDGKTQGDWVKALEGARAVINLAGSPISVKWTPENQKAIISSRIDSGKAVGEALSQLGEPPKVWVNASATGFYGDRGDTVLYESAEVGKGFLADVCQIWEETVVKACPSSIRMVLFRTGLVLGREGGLLKPMRKLALFGLGGAAGSGNQWMPWIHLEDTCRMYRFVIENERVSGPINGSAPEPVRNKEFMSRLRQELSRPWSPPAPAFALKLIGELSGPDPDLLLSSQRALPRSAIDHGFSWNYPNLGTALIDLLKSPAKGAFIS